MRQSNNFRSRKQIIQNECNHKSPHKHLQTFLSFVLLSDQPQPFLLPLLLLPPMYSRGEALNSSKMSENSFKPQSVLICPLFGSRAKVLNKIIAIVFLDTFQHIFLSIETGHFQCLTSC